jgi:radical SAM/Cys-rich protein
MHATLPLLKGTDFPFITRKRLQTLQVNLGYRCNQSCVHCHVNAGPKRTEEMDAETVSEVIRYLEVSTVRVLDLTGGAPELNANFRRLVHSARQLGVHVIDRCNLTILEEPGQEDLADFLAAERVEVVASLPCYLQDNVDAQRGKGVYDGSIRGLRKLNAVGYGKGGKLTLSLVFNPQGPVLPPPQAELERDYREFLDENFSVQFDRLLTLANLPIGRFGSILVSKGQFEDYMALLREAYRDENLDGVMCRTTLSVDWQGYVYDCDFNQMLSLPAPLGGQQRSHLSELMSMKLEDKPIMVLDHCFACTAGQGSSCGGALS